MSFANSLIDTNSYQGIAVDRRSYKVGEPIVILVIESTSAESSAGTGTGKSVDLGISAFDSVNVDNIGFGYSGNKEGNGQTVRRGTATTTLSAVITEVLPNGMFKLKGEHNLVVNEENQKILINGYARLIDISKDNTLLSNRIANANIEIQGTGNVSRAQKDGLITKVFKWLGLL